MLIELGLIGRVEQIVGRANDQRFKVLASGRSHVHLLPRSAQMSAAQQFSKALPRPKNSRLDGAYWNLEGNGNFAILESFDVAKDDRLTMLDRQCSDVAIDSIAIN